jgi:2-(1,2-epoxy-1,2-dihydrophenyl)acetyl-CoA isomerase
VPTHWETLLVSEQAGVATVAIHRPDNYNAASNETIAELYACLSDIAERDDIHAVQLTGTGRVFCPGAEVRTDTAGSFQDFSFVLVDGKASPIYHVAALLHEMPPLTIATINGGCAGAGFGFACACDIRVAKRSAKFTTAFLSLGVPGDMAVPWSLPRLVGSGVARHLSFLPDKFDAVEAHRIGLVSAVYEDDDYADRVEALLARLRDANPAGVRALKQNYLSAERMGMAEYASLESERNVTFFAAAGLGGQDSVGSSSDGRE